MTFKKFKSRDLPSLSLGTCEVIPDGIGDLPANVFVLLDDPDHGLSLLHSVHAIWSSGPGCVT